MGRSHLLLQVPTPYCWLSLGLLEDEGPVILQLCHFPPTGLKLFPTFLGRTVDNYSLLTPNEEHEQAWVPWLRVHTMRPVC